MLIQVYDGFQLLESTNCRVVLVPYGRRGAVWRGLAYPLRQDGASIDAAGEVTFAPSACQPDGFQAPAADWAVIDGADEAYILVAGSGLDLETTVSKLKHSGLQVLRSGRYLADAGDDAAHDWFIRVTKPAQGSLNARVTDVLGGKASETDADLRVRVLKAEVEAARAREAKAREELECLRECLRDPQPDEVDVEAHRLLDLEREARKAAEVELQDVRQRLDGVLSVAPRPVAEIQGKAAKRIQTEVETTILALLPRIRLLRESLEVMAIEYPDRRGVYRALSELQRSDRGLPSEWKTVQGAEHWIERHVSDGQANTGRAYARLDPSDATWEVLISDKGRQKLDMDWLRRR